MHRHPKHTVHDTHVAAGRFEARDPGDKLSKLGLFAHLRCHWAWKGTFEQNQGPETGAEALPGTYTVRLHVDGATVEQPLTIKADPRDTATAADLEMRYALLVALNAALGNVDTMLNAIDVRTKHASGAERSRLNAFKHRLTQDPRNIEDLGTVQLRERLLDLLGRVGSTSFAAPTASQEAAAATLRAQTQSLTHAYAGLR